jgi:electron transport complex protein RnfG
MIGYIRQGWLVLLLGLLFGLALAGVDAWLSPMIAENQQLARQKAAVEVIPGGQNAEQVVVDGTTVFRVTGVGGQLVGWAIPASGQGYGDTIRLIVGVTADGSKLTDFRVIYNQETPGLGNKIVEPGFRSRFEGKDASVQLQAVQKPQADDEIQALTGATISSQAVADIIYKQLNDSGLLNRLAGGGTTGSTATMEH